MWVICVWVDEMMCDDEIEMNVMFFGGYFGMVDIIEYFMGLLGIFVVCIYVLECFGFFLVDC